VDQDLLLLGVDGGGTNCRARLSAMSGTVLADAVTGPANLRLGLEQSFSSVMEAAARCLTRAGMGGRDFARVVACLALAGASEPNYAAAAKAYKHPFHRAVITTDAHAACVGAHGDRDGGIIVAGTGSVGWALVKGETYRVGGWGLPLSDEGSGAWLGTELLRLILWAHDGRTTWTPLLRNVFADFGEDPHAILEWLAQARPGDLGAFAPRIVDFANEGDQAGVELMSLAAKNIDALAARLISVGADRLSLVGGLSPSLRSWLSNATQSHLVEPEGDALTGALVLARKAAQRLTRAA
jgi:glucosamine kinase